MIQALTKNLFWKLLSLGLAVLLWGIFVRDPELSTTVAVPVLFRGMPADLELSGNLIDRVQLEVRGPSAQLTPDDLARAAVVLDLGNIERPGDRTYTIQESRITLPSGVTCTRAVPSQVRLHFERRISRRVPVRIRISDPPPDGYRVVAQSAEPESLAIVGPQSNVEQVSFVDTDSIDLTNVFSATEFEVNAFVADEQVRFGEPPRVKVRITVEISTSQE